MGEFQQLSCPVRIYSEEKSQLQAAFRASPTSLRMNSSTSLGFVKLQRKIILYMYRHSNIISYTGIQSCITVYHYYILTSKEAHPSIGPTLIWNKASSTKEIINCTIIFSPQYHFYYLFLFIIISLPFTLLTSELSLHLEYVGRGLPW